MNIKQGNLFLFFVDYNIFVPALGAEWNAANLRKKINAKRFDLTVALLSDEATQAHIIIPLKGINDCNITSVQLEEAIKFRQDEIHLIPEDVTTDAYISKIVAAMNLWSYGSIDYYQSLNIREIKITAGEEDE